MAEKTSGAQAAAGGAANPYAVYIKLGLLLLSILILVLPLTLIMDLVQERTKRRDQVVRQIGAVWGKPQWITGPVLVIPYTYEHTAKERVDMGDGKIVQRDVKRTATAYLHVLPEAIAVAGKVIPSERYRGIYKSTVYSADLTIRGTFSRPDLGRLGIDPAAVKWSEAVLALGLSDPRSANSGLMLRWGDKTIPFEPQTTRPRLLSAGVHAAAPLPPPGRAGDGRIAFRFDLNFAGHKRLAVAPVGKVSRLELESPWRHPSFDGAYLPSERRIDDDGFKARWEVSYLGRGYPQVWTDQPKHKNYLAPGPLARKMTWNSLGLSLVTPVDFYLKSERAVKYGILFVVLVFAAIFVFEMLTGAALHPVHYVLMGIALVLFDLLLLSLAEVIGFAAAYGVAALMATLMISSYFGKILGAWRRGAFIVPLLAFVYGYLYVILQLEDLALLAGALGLFATLAAVMYVTRNVDWNALVDLGRPQSAKKTGQPAKG